MTNDWLDKVAQEICYDLQDIGYRSVVADEINVKTIKAAFLRLSPFKEDMAYIPVPRCDRCMYWDKDVSDRDQGQCLIVLHDSTKIWPDLYDGINTAADFGCVQWKEKEV